LREDIQAFALQFVKAEQADCLRTGSAADAG